MLCCAVLGWAGLGWAVIPQVPVWQQIDLQAVIWRPLRLVLQATCTKQKHSPSNCIADVTETSGLGLVHSASNVLVITSRGCVVASALQGPIAGDVFARQTIEAAGSFLAAATG